MQTWLSLAERAETTADRLLLLAPKKQGQPEKLPANRAWLSDFMGIFRNTNGINISEAYRILETAYRKRDKALPSEVTVRAVLKQIPPHILQAGRLTGSRLKALKTYIKRNWNDNPNNTIWVGDGHTLKMKVAHPAHGQPFSPELTLIMDTSCRYIVGWSLSYSESCLAVGDALRHAIVKHGIPAMYYSDNGSGQANKTFDTEITGIFARLGIEHHTGIAGNPQGRGIIERQMQIVPHQVAQSFATYYGRGADPETVRKTLSGVASLAKSIPHEVMPIDADVELTEKQKKALGKLPKWSELLAVVEEKVQEYNHTHRSSALGGLTPAEARAEKDKSMNPEDYFPITEAEAMELFRPSFVRICQRGYLRLFGSAYWHENLENWDGREVVIYADQHDPSEVIVRDKKGNWICNAVLNGNTVDAFPKNIVEQAKEKRAKRRLKRLEEKAQQVQAEIANRDLQDFEMFINQSALPAPTGETLIDLLQTNEPDKIADPIYLFESDKE